MDFEDFVVREPKAMAMPVALETHSLEDSLRFSRGWVEVRKHTWSRPAEYAWTLRDGVYLINLALSPRPTPTKIAHLGLGRRSAPWNMGRIVMIPPCVGVHVDTPATGQLRSMRCAFDSGMIESLLQRKPKWDERLLREATHLQSHQIEWLMLKIYHELRHKGFASEIVVESLATALGVELVRHFRFEPLNETAGYRGGLSARRMRLVRDRVHAELPAPCLSELAELCGISVRQLGRGFKAETGQTIGTFVETAMVERARNLLASTNLSIGEIARTLGFATSASFAYAFRRATGFRPSEVEGRRPTP
jgi:AraC family transcriptional regulator